MIVKRFASKRHNKYVGELHVFNCIFMLTITLLRTFEQKGPFCKIALCFQIWCHLMIALDNLMSMLVSTGLLTVITRQETTYLIFWSK